MFRPPDLYIMRFEVETPTHKRFTAQAGVSTEFYKEADFDPAWDAVTEELKYKMYEHLGLRREYPNPPFGARGLNGEMVIFNREGRLW